MSALGVGAHQPAAATQAEGEHDPNAMLNALNHRPNNPSNAADTISSSSVSTKTANEKDGGYEDIHIASSCPSVHRRRESEPIDPEGEERVVKLARQMSAMSAVTSSSVGTTVRNPFVDSTDPALDPNSDKFNVRKWLKTLLHISSRDPERYPKQTAGLSFRNLNVHGFGKPTDYQKDVGNIFLSGFEAVKSLFGQGSKQKIQILRDFDGLINSGELLVVLGRPGSGCSTLLKTIARETHGFHIDENSHLNYQGIPQELMQKNFRGEVIYQAETDVHFPHLTVAETLSFAAKARAPRNRIQGISRDQYAEHMRDAVMAIFGLTDTFHTKVGNDFVRGVSGGQRKRVSIAEVTLSFAPLQCWDNSTRGLDSATALEFIKTLRMSTELGGSTAVVAIYQASQDAYDLFDKVIVLYEGRQIYFGPTESAKAYFLEMGFLCPERQTTADFLTSLTSPAERVVKPGYENLVPRTPDEFAQRWKDSEDRKLLLADIERFDQEFPLGGEQVAKFKEARKAQQAKRMSVKSPYTISVPMQVKLCMVRGFQRLKNDMSMMFTTIFGNFILALIVGSVFYNLPDTTSSFFSRGALLFFAILLNAFSSALEILTLYAQRPIVEKHAKYALYHPFSEAISSMLVDLPTKIIVSISFNLTLYFMTNLRRTVDAFFVFLLFSFCCTLTMSMIFRTIASFSRTLSQAMPPAAIFILALVIYTGFTIPTRDMVVWFRWINYINPIGYAFESLMVNEFHGRNFPCAQFVPAYPNVASNEHICSVTGAQAGASTVNGDTYIETSFEYKKSHEWRNLGIIFAFMFFFLATHLIGTEWISAAKSKGEVLVFRRGKMPSYMKAKAQDEEVPMEKAKVAQNGAPDANDTSAAIVRQTAIFHWQDVVYDIKIKGKDRRLLDHVDGWVKPGTLTALMGVSGAGKTTLLDVLANRVTMGVVTGGMLVDGRQRDQSFQRKTGYVQQQDLHLETSTVREALLFSAKLRQPKHVPESEKKEYVEEVIKLLEMEEYAGAVVGVPGEGLNVEQRKRLTIGVELAAKPDLLLFLDEPTSGLDSQTAWSICSLMRKLAENGQAILCTIHQPSAILFQAFDRLLFLQRGGKTVYFGEIGENSKILTSYFERNGSPPCPPDANPAEWMLEVIGAAPGAHTDKDWSEVWKNSPEKVAVKEHLAELERELSQKETVDRGAGTAEFAASFPTQVWTCTQRVFEQYWRTPSYIYAKLFLCLVTALFIGFSFYMAGTSLQGLQNQMFSVFMLLTIYGNLSQQMMPHFVTQRALYEVRERPSKAYSWIAFMTCNIVVELPWQTFMAVLSFVSYYYPIGLWKNAQLTDTMNERAALMFLLIWAFYIWTSTFTHMIIAGIETAETGGNIGQLLFSFSLIFCGVLATPQVLPGFWIFMYRVSPFTYLVGGMLAAGLGRAKVNCSDIEVLTFDPPSNETCQEYMATYVAEAGGTVLNPSATSQCQFCTVADTDVYLQEVSVNYDDRWRNFGILMAYIVFNIFMAYVFYWLARVPKKWGKKVKSQ